MILANAQGKDVRVEPLEKKNTISACIRPVQQRHARSNSCCMLSVVNLGNFDIMNERKGSHSGSACDSGGRTDMELSARSTIPSNSQCGSYHAETRASLAVTTDFFVPGTKICSGRRIDHSFPLLNAWPRVVPRMDKCSFSASKLQHTMAMEEGCHGFSDFLHACKQDALAQLDVLNTVIWKVTTAIKASEGPRYPQILSCSFSSLEALALFEGKPLCCTVDRYLRRIIKYSGCSTCNIYIALMFIQRIRRSTCPAICLSQTNAQRMLLTAIMVASKMYDDIYYSNKHWGLIGELGAAEMKALELCFLSLLNFDCMVQREEYESFLEKIQKTSESLFHMDEYTHDDDDSSFNEDNRSLWMRTKSTPSAPPSYDHVRLPLQTGRKRIVLKPLPSSRRSSDNTCVR
jgi:hypothetical protein